MRSASRLAAATVAVFSAASGCVAHAATAWKQEGFADFSRGAATDAGSNLYVSANGRIQIINRWDLNNDGLLDVIVPSGHAHTEKENTYIYLNNRGDIDGRSRIEIPGGGSAGGLVADLNRDGLADLVVVNSADSHVKEVSTWIYWGHPEGFSASRRTELPAFSGKAAVAGDFNGDTWPDLAIACEWTEPATAGATPRKVSLIYWNSPTGFDHSRRLALPLGGETARSLAAADLDGDGRDDLVVAVSDRLHLFRSSGGAFEDGQASETSDVKSAVIALGDFDSDGIPDLALGRKGAVAVIPGRSGGFAFEKERIVSAVSDPRGLAAADFDGDKFDDLAVANYASEGGATWTDSLVLLSKGGGFPNDATTNLPTLGASGVSAGDLNGDGIPELVFSHENVTNQQDLHSYVYWNNGGRFRYGEHTQLRTAGTVGNAIGDVDNDGDPDVVFFNSEGGFRDGASETYVYWGDGTRAFSQERRLTIPTHQVFGHGHADLDDDGFVDLVLTRENFISTIPHEPSGISIHWGGASGFLAPTDITATSAYGGVRFADLNRDGWLDILSGGHNFDPRNPERTGIPIYWGSAEGFRRENRSVVTTDNDKVRGPLLADLNRDGWLDIAAQEDSGTITIWPGSASGFESTAKIVIDLGRPDALMYLQAADFNRDGWLDLLLPQRGPPDGTETTSLILYGSPSGFRREKGTTIPSYVPYQNTIADLDRDGWLDIVLCSYGGEVSGNRPSLVYWGGPNGFLERPRTELPTYGSSGSVALDFDGDGWLDLFFANHRRSGSTVEPQPHRHITESMLYWGGPDGFSPERRWDVIGRGPGGLNLRDPGNAYDRALHEDYVSATFRVPDRERLSAIQWTAATPHGTSVRFQVRQAADAAALQSALWVGPDGADSWWETPGVASTAVRGGFIQYRARLATPNGAASPVLTQVALQFE